MINQSKDEQPLVNYQLKFSLRKNKPSYSLVVQQELIKEAESSSLRGLFKEAASLFQKIGIKYYVDDLENAIQYFIKSSKCYLKYGDYQNGEKSIIKAQNALQDFKSKIQSNNSSKKMNPQFQQNLFLKIQFDIYYVWGLLQFYEKKIQESIEKFEKALELNEQHDQWLIENDNDNDDEVEVLFEGIESDIADIYEKLFEAHLEAKQYGACLQIFELIKKQYQIIDYFPGKWLKLLVLKIKMSIKRKDQNVVLTLFKEYLEKYFIDFIENKEEEEISQQANKKEQKNSLFGAIQESKNQAEEIVLRYFEESNKQTTETQENIPSATTHQNQDIINNQKLPQRENQGNRVKTLKYTEQKKISSRDKAFLLYQQQMLSKQDQQSKFEIKNINLNTLLTLKLNWKIQTEQQLFIYETLFELMIKFGTKFEGVSARFCLYQLWIYYKAQYTSYPMHASIMEVYLKVAMNLSQSDIYQSIELTLECLGMISTEYQQNNHPMSIKALIILTILYLETNNEEYYEQAEKNADSLLSIQQSLYGQYHYNTIQALEIQIRVALKQYDGQRVVTLLQKCISIFSRWHGFNNIILGNYYLRLIEADIGLSQKKVIEYFSKFREIVLSSIQQNSYDTLANIDAELYQNQTSKSSEYERCVVDLENSIRSVILKQDPLINNSLILDLLKRLECEKFNIRHQNYLQTMKKKSQHS